MGEYRRGQNAGDLARQDRVLIVVEKKLFEIRKVVAATDEY